MRNKIINLTLTANLLQWYFLVYIIHVICINWSDCWIKKINSNKRGNELKRRLVKGWIKWIKRKKFWSWHLLLGSFLSIDSTILDIEQLIWVMDTSRFTLYQKIKVICQLSCCLCDVVKINEKKRTMLKKYLIRKIIFTLNE